MSRAGIAIAEPPSALAELAAAARSAGAPEAAILRAAAEALGVRYLGVLAELSASPDFIARIPINFARQHKIMGFGGRG